ncbi:hypothetical protein Droror1_Dr00003438 [Drosera rotundifolia]
MVEEANLKAESSAGSSTRSGTTVAKCQDMIRKSLRTPMVKFLLEHMEKEGCSVGDNFIKPVDCDMSISGGYVRGGGVIVCSDQITIQDEVNQVVIHELIHAYDDCRAANLDWTNCAHHACSEIRAGHLSGDCHYKRELLRGYAKLRGHEQDCVKRRVMKSVISNPNCSETTAREAMEAVWDICYNDTKPFDRAP